MLLNLFAGAILIIITVFTHSAGLLVLSWLLRGTVARYSLHRNRWGAMMAMTATVFGLFVIHAIEIGIWALAFVAVGALPDLESAMFFSFLSFSTLGAEPVSAHPEWQLFGSIEGLNGFLLIGWSTAYLIPAWTRHGPFHEDRHF